MRLLSQMKENDKKTPQELLKTAQDIAHEREKASSALLSKASKQGWNEGQIVNGTPFLTQLEPKAAGNASANEDAIEETEKGNARKDTARNHYQYSSHTGWRSLHRKGRSFEPLRSKGFEGPAVYRGHGTQGGPEVDPSVPYPVSGFTTLGSKKKSAQRLGEGRQGEPALFFE